MFTLISECQPAEDPGTLWTSAWSTDRKKFAVGGDQGKLMIFDAQTFELESTFPFPEVIISRVKWHPTRNMLAVTTQSESLKTVIINFDTGEVIQMEGLPHSLRGW